jgi:hypothetical protein
MDNFRRGLLHSHTGDEASKLFHYRCHIFGPVTKSYELLSYMGTRRNFSHEGALRKNKTNNAKKPKYLHQSSKN